MMLSEQDDQESTISGNIINLIHEGKYNELNALLNNSNIELTIFQRDNILKILKIKQGYNKYEMKDIIKYFYEKYNEDVEFINNLNTFMVELPYGIFYLKKYFDLNLSIDIINNLLFKCKFNNFMFFFEKYNYITLIDKIEIQQQLENVAAFNYDDRIFNFIINIYKDKLILNTTFYTYLLTRPLKYIYKRLKKIYGYIKNKLLNDNYYINTIFTIPNIIIIFKKIFNLYYLENCILNNDCINCLSHDLNFDIIKNNIYPLLNTYYEKCRLNIYYFINNKVLLDNIDLNYDYNNDHFISSYIFGKDEFTDKNIHNYFLKFIKYRRKYSHDYFYLIPYTKLINNNVNYIKLYIKLKLFARKFKQNFDFKKKTLIRPILNALNNLKPNKNIKVLKNGTRFYKNNKQKFCHNPPHSIFPCELETIKKCLIREKADGITVKELPLNIYPNIYFKNIKAEYIDYLDLYLIIDIDISFNILERYDYLRNNHHNTKGVKINTITNIKELIECIKEEREIFNKFMKEPYDTFRWYPKAAWLINKIDDSFCQELYNFINMNSPYLDYIISEGSYNNDGLIISPLNGDNEIKLKPKNLMTIDLKYKNKYFYDRDNNKYNINTSEISSLIDNTIYRCYPKDGEIYAKDIRFDKSRPNPYNIVNNIINLIKIDYTEKKESKYFTKNKYSFNKIWENIIINNSNNIKYMVKSMYNNDTCLDLGCGKLKMNDFIEFKKYTGYDYDNYILVKCMNKIINNSINNININYINIRGNWNETKDKWYDVNYNKYMNIFMINSLMHFNTDIFWEQLDKVTIKGSRLLFNLLKDIKIDENIDDNSYMKSNDGIINYYFDCIHEKEMIEKHVTIKNVEEYLNKYNFKIKEKYTSSNKDITDLFEWYIYEKY